VSIDPERAKSDWLRHQLKSGALAGLLGHSRIFQYLTAAAPGLSELVTMGAVWDLAQLERRLGGSTYDLAIVDAPATGHGIALLRSPKTFADIARGGADPPAGDANPQLRDRPQGNGRDGGGAGRGDARERERSSWASGCGPSWAWRSTRSS